jgi:uncharacterized protein
MLYPAEFGTDPLFPEKSDFKVIHANEDTGFGVISYRAFKRGDIIAKMSGYVVPEIMQHTLQISATKHNHDPYFSGFFLHSCSPNISLNMETMLITALKDIPENSMLYMDYAETEDYLFKQFPCSCGSTNCRGWITGRAETETVTIQKKQRTS